MANVVTFPTGEAVVEITVDKIRDAIIRKAGPGNSVTTKRVGWFPLRDAVTGMAMLSGCPENERNAVLASMKRTFFDIGQPCPIKPSLIVFGLFEEENEVRVYCMGPSDPQPEEKAYLVLARYRLSKAASIYSMDELTPNAFIDEMSDEFVQLREGLNSAEKERAAVLEYGEIMAEHAPGETPYTLKEFLEDLREGLHVESGENDEEDEPEPPAVKSEPPAVKSEPAAVKPEPTAKQTAATVPAATTISTPTPPPPPPPASP